MRPTGASFMQLCQAVDTQTHTSSRPQIAPQAPAPPASADLPAGTVSVPKRAEKPAPPTSSSPAPKESSDSGEDSADDAEALEADLPLLSPPDEVSTNLPVSPSDDFRSYADLVRKMAARLGITTSQPLPVIEDVFFDVVQSRTSSTVAIPLSKAMLDSAKISGSKPASAPISNKKLDHIYQI